MENFNFSYDDKEYILRADNCSYILNDEESPVQGLETADIIEMLNQQQTVDFDVEYYDSPCQKCFAGKSDNSKYFKFLEYHFFIFTKNRRFVTSNISKDYEGKSYSKLLRTRDVDNSYIVSIIVCEKCGEYSIEIEQCEV